MLKTSVWRQWLKPSIVFNCLTGIILLVNVFYLTIFATRKYLDKMEWYEPGYQFRMFREPLKFTDTVGYITDKKLTREANDGSYLQAQYYLAPVLITPGYAGDEFNIIDSEDWKFILGFVGRTRSTRVTNNNYGQALLRRTR